MSEGPATAEQFTAGEFGEVLRLTRHARRVRRACSLAVGLLCGALAGCSREAATPAGQTPDVPVPQAADQPSVNLEIVRDGGMLLVNAPAADDLTGSVEPVSIRTALQN